MKRGHSLLATALIGLVIVLGIGSYFAAIRPTRESANTPVKKTGVPLSDPVPAVPATFSTNAADSYRQAAALIHEFQQDIPEQVRHEAYVDRRFDDETDAFFQRHAAILALIHAGARAQTVDWSPLTMTARLALQNDVNSAARFLDAHGRWMQSKKDYSQVADDALAEMTVSRHMGSNAIIVSKLVEIAIESRATDLLAGVLPSLSKTQLQALPPRLDALPKSTTSQELLMNEVANSKQMLREQGNGLLITAMADGLAQFYGEIGPAMDQPPQEFAQAVDAAVAKYSANMFVQQMSRSIKTQQTTLAVARARRDMLRTAIEIQNNGDSVVTQSKDPFGTGPFEFLRTAVGFELTSQLQNRGKPVNLAVGGQ